MSWRTVIITHHAKLNYKNNYLLIRGTEANMVHLSEINTLIVDSTIVTVTSLLLCELMKRKIKVIFCDEKRNPISELIPYYGAHNTSKKLFTQITWDEYYKKFVWTNIIKQKILNQANLLHKLQLDNAQLLFQYSEELQFYDETNREGHAAKVYFNTLFGKGFSRDDENEINAALDYGYTILLSNFNKEIVSNGYSTQLGIKHINEYNQFNLSSDLMEPFRIVVDSIVYGNKEKILDSSYKYQLVNMLNMQMRFDGKLYYLSTVIQLYLKKVFTSIEKKSIQELELFQFP